MASKTDPTKKNPLNAVEEDLKLLQELDLPDEAAGLLRDALLHLEDARKEKAEFVSTVAHELRVPMTSIMGYTDLLKQEAVGGLNPQQLDFLTVIRENVGRMAKLVADLSDIYKAESGRLHLEVVSVSVQDAVLRGLEQVSSHLNGRSEAVAVQLPENLPAVLADPKRLAQIIAYLVENAALYSDGNEPITVRAEVDSSKSFVRLLVTDVGIGVQEGDQLYIFTPFFRSEEEEVRAHKGWGLSLSLVKSLAELSGGEAGFETEPGQGSTFWFTVPVGS